MAPPALVSLSRVCLSVGLVALLLAGGWGCAHDEPRPAEAPTVDLTRGDLRPPLTVTERRGPTWTHVLDRYRGPQVAAAQIDSSQSYVYTHDSSVQAWRDVERERKNLWEFPLPVEFLPAIENQPCAHVYAGYDFNDDDAADVVALAPARDGSRWRLWLLDGRSGVTLGQMDLPVGEDRRADGQWDGVYSAVRVGRFATGNGPRTGVVVVCNVGWDVDGRGILAIDPLAGEVLWRHGMAVKPLWNNVDVVDLDGDGLSEIAYGATYAGNIEPGTAALLDDHAEVGLLDAAGQLVWSRRVGDRGAYLRTRLLSGAGGHSPRLVALTANTKRDDTRLELFELSRGELLDSRRLTRFNDMLDVIEEGSSAQGADSALEQVPRQLPKIVTASSSGVLSLFEVGDSELRLVRRALVDGRVWSVQALDVLGDDRPEVIVEHGISNVWVLDEQLDPLVFHDAGNETRLLSFLAWRPSRNHKTLVVQGEELGVLSFGSAPGPPFPWTPTLAGAAVFVSLAMLVVQRRRSKRAGSPREAARRLLEVLELSNHGAVGCLKGLRRMNWQLQALASGLGRSEETLAHLEEIAAEASDHALPTTRGHLEAAATSGLELAELATALRTLSQLEAALSHAREAKFSSEYLERHLSDLLELAARAEQELQALRERVSEQFRVNIAECAARVLSAHQPALEQLGVDVQCEGPETAHARVDREEFDFLLENLVANALRAMQDSKERHLTVRWSVEHSLLRVRVRDSGCGIAEDDRERILSSRYSTREGGGLGLFRSRELLRKYGGNLRVEESQPGRGTTFVVEVPEA